jgi:polyhydroxyalkanoate synthase
MLDKTITPGQKKVPFDPFGILPLSMSIIEAWSRHPDEFRSRCQDFWVNLWEVQQQVMLRSMGRLMPDFVPALSVDERFRDQAWTENPWFDFLKEYYLLSTRAIEDAIYATPDVTERNKRKAAFWARHTLNALAPGNFLWSNPEALNRFISTGGQSLLEGYRQWLADLHKGEISMVNETAYQLGKDIANTPGKVVFRNHLMEVIQYVPSTSEVYKIPIVIIAPWINKYYILDIARDKSLIRYLVDNGFTVFVTSWKNPGPEMRDTTLDEYMTDGALAIINTAREICGVESVHAIGYCIGGTLLAILQAWLAQQKGTSPIAHWTLLTTLVDFSSPGDMDAFITEESIKWLEQRMQEQGYLDGKDMGTTFRWLRANSLIWRYITHNYLYGETPPPMDVLQWNVDCTRLPQAMHSFYLREFYLNNRLIEPQALVIAGHPIDLGLIKTPLYAVGTEQDHIAPWRETFKIAELISAPVRYTLASSGHILGILSPPIDPPKRRYWSGEVSGKMAPDAWQQAVKKITGSWWDDWYLWLEERCGPKVPARTTGNDIFPVLADAPGTYVMEK